MNRRDKECDKSTKNVSRCICNVEIKGRGGVECVWW